MSPNVLYIEKNLLLALNGSSCVVVGDGRIVCRTKTGQFL